MQNGSKSILDKYKVSNSRLLNDIQQCTPQWGVQATERSCDSKMEGLRPDKFQFAEVIISWKNINVLVVDISPITFHQAKTAGIFALSVFGRMTHSLLLMMNPATLTME